LSCNKLIADSSKLTAKKLLVKWQVNLASFLPIDKFIVVSRLQLCSIIHNFNLLQMKNLFTSFLCLLVSVLSAQQMTQTIRGIILDKESKMPIVGASVVVVNSNPIIGFSTDTLGVFKLQNVPIGRQSVAISFVGYKPQVINDLQLNAAKEVVLSLELEENALELNSVTVTANTKSGVVNDMVSISGRTFSPKETGRYAGSLNDPSRMARNYAGVMGANDQRNDIIIRGNSPLGLLWRLEGIPIPNPNHFGGQGSTGGPVSIINPLVLSNSDFLTGAFPAEYGNATSGAFDLKLRNGNNEKREHTLTFGAFGLEAMTEGPLSKNTGSSYFVSYRYSTLSILSGLGVKLGFASVPTYQDLTFKLNLLTKKAGTFSLFGIGGTSSTAFYDNKRDTTQFSPAYKGEDVYFGSKTGILGLKHSYIFKNNAYIKTTFAVTYEGNAAHRDSIIPDKGVIGIGGFGYQNVKAVLSSFVNKKISPQHAIQAGFSVEQISYATKDSAFKYTDASGNRLFNYKNDFDGNTTLFQAYTQWKYKINNDLTLNTGLHFQYFNLNKQAVIEPRVGVNWQVKSNQTLSLGYGLHNQTQLYGFYFYKNPLTKIETNRDLKFTQSNQVVLGYDISFANNFRFKAETYYQYLNNVPVEQKLSSYSILNEAGSFTIDNYRDSLVNTGSGRNYGLELTFEKFFDQNYYLLFTASFFDSKYKGSDGISRNTAYNGNFVVNALGGYELKLKHNLTLLFNAKVTVAGGLPYTSIDSEASIANRKPIYNETEAYGLKNEIYIKPDIRGGLRKSFKNKTAIEVSFDLQNVINRKNVYFRVFDKNTSRVNTVFQNGRFPTFQVQFEF
jgi:CarboxypepD_reg-like domain